MEQTLPAGTPQLITDHSLALPLRRALLPIVGETLPDPEALIAARAWLSSYLLSEVAASHTPRPLELHVLCVVESEPERKRVEIDLLHLIREVLGASDGPVSIRKLVRVASDPLAEMAGVVERSWIDLLVVSTPDEGEWRGGLDVRRLCRSLSSPVLLLPPSPGP